MAVHNPPHGGVLVERLAGADEAAEWRGRQRDLPSITLNERQVSDLEMIGTGGLSPLSPSHLSGWGRAATPAARCHHDGGGGGGGTGR